jgi:nonspecific dipeptidase
LSLHGIEGAFSEPGCKTVIPRKVIGKFSIRIVPNQTPEKVEQVVVAYLNKLWKVRNSTNKMKVCELPLLLCYLLEGLCKKLVGIISTVKSH